MEENRLVKYVVITFLITWICWWGEAFILHFGFFTQEEIIPTIIFTIGGFGPTFAACFCFREKFSIRILMKFLFGYKANGIWYWILFVLLEVATFVLSSKTFNPSINLGIVPFILIQAVFLYGGNEELGWRGTMQPILQEKFSYPIATSIVGIVWAIWHLPLWFIKGNSHQGMSFWLFAILAILLSYWLSAIYNSSGSVFLCMISHGVTNTLLSVLVIRINAILIIGIVLLTILANWISWNKVKK